MKLKEIFYMLGIRPKIKKFDCDIININFSTNEMIQWAKWKNPRCRELPRLEDYEILKKFIQPGDLTIDIGAHVGDTTLPPALVTGTSGLVIALEPNPATFAVLETNSKLNKERTNIIPINAAAMPEDGDFVFQYNDPSLINGGYQKGISIFKHASFFKINVKGVNLGSLLKREYNDRLKHLSFIKTDLEGGDYQAFLTLKEIISEYMPVIQSEINGVMRRETRRNYIKSLNNLGYDIYALKGYSINDLLSLDQSMIDSKETFDIFAVPPRFRDIFKE